jgi:SAM-dependent methyltransferase
MELAVARGWTATGVEYAASTIAATAKRTGLPVMSLEEVERSTARFDVIYLSDVLPHVPDPGATCERVVALLKPGGSLLVSGPVDAEASLVEWTARALKRLRRALGRDAIAERPPTMLVRTTRRAELRFFSERLGLRVDRFTIYETGWPYRTSQPVRGAGAAVRHAIGTLAVGLARVTPGERLGNRFLAVLSAK